uniref:Uncharacterized protein MANES_07G032600 n=1 Tax=Rhizophora mucronata TaxID=61149 RepID=A0A2P2KGV2_RHIMU
MLNIWLILWIPFLSLPCTTDLIFLCVIFFSPGGQHFVSSKEVSAYLQSLFGPHGPLQAKDPAVDNTRQAYILASESHLGAAEKDEVQGEHTKVDLLGFENLAEVQIHDLFECYKCNVKFDEKDTYLQHLLSLHQRTTRRYRLGSSVGDGVIVKDGKYECQFCHKVFHERRRYNGHVGIHVRNYVRGIEDSPAVRISLEKRSDSPSEDELPTRISKMDALIEIAQNSIQETSTNGLNNESVVEMAVDEQNAGSNTELHSLISDHEQNSDSPLSEEDDLMADKSLEPEIHEKKYYHMTADEKMGIIDEASDMLEVRIGLSNVVQHDNGDTSGKDGENIDHLKHEVDKSKLVEIEIGFRSNNSALDNDLGQHTTQKPFKEDLIHHVVPEHPIQMLQSSPCSSLPNAIIEKGENKLDIIEKKHDKVTRSEELRMEEIEQPDVVGSGQDSVSLPKGITQMEGEHDAPVHLESEVVNTANGQQLITECVWCGVEFSHEAVDAEVQSDSVGYMCPTCKSKISGQFDVSGSDCS